MQKKSTAKSQLNKLAARIEAALEKVNSLCDSTPTPKYSAAPDPNILKQLLNEAQDSDFWMNFKKAAPIIFCMAVENDEQLKAARDMSFIEELLKTKSILQLLNGKIQEGSADVDLIDYTTATSMLENKLSILSALNISVEGDGDDKVSFNLVGMNKSIVIDKEKLKEAVTIQDVKVDEKEATGSSGTAVAELNAAELGEEGFIKAAVDAIGEVKKTPQKTLEKETFIKVFKYTGDFAKFKNSDLKKAAQEKRCEFFGKDAQQYLGALKQNIQDEEKAYEQSSTIMFDALSITQECFEKSQQSFMNDPYVSMELFNLGISMEKPNEEVPEELTEEKTIELVKASNDFAFDLFKKEYISQLHGDPMLMPVLISAIAHDWV